MVSEAIGFEAFFRAQHPRLVALALAMVGDRDIARDLAQETLTRAFRHWSSVAAYEQPSAWARRVLVNLVTDRARRGVSEARALQRLDAGHVCWSPEPFDDAWRRAVLDLPDRQRAVIVLHYVEDCSVDTIADVLEIAAGTVKATLVAGKRNLRRILEREQQP
jgi:RNA polymerase sigma factor (sigma-70 family)